MPFITEMQKRHTGNAGWVFVTLLSLHHEVGSMPLQRKVREDTATSHARREAGRLDREKRKVTDGEKGSEPDLLMESLLASRDFL